MGFTQEQLAATLGIDRTTVQRWESGERETQPWLRSRLATALQVSRDELDRLLAQAHTDSSKPPVSKADLTAGSRSHESELGGPRS
jgi:transcriptional regulator with XRE-family HTH domain